MKVIILILIAYSLTFAQDITDIEPADSINYAIVYNLQPDTVYFPFYNDSVYLVKDPWTWYDEYVIKKELMMYELHGFYYVYLVWKYDANPFKDEEWECFRRQIEVIMWEGERERWERQK